MPGQTLAMVAIQRGLVVANFRLGGRAIVTRRLSADAERSAVHQPMADWRLR